MLASSSIALAARNDAESACSRLYRQEYSRLVLAAYFQRRAICWHVSRKRQFLSSSSARRIALAAQGFGTARPEGATNAGHVKRTIDRLGLLQIDSVNVLARAHYLPLSSRLRTSDTHHPHPLASCPKTQLRLSDFC